MDLPVRVGGVTGAPVLATGRRIVDHNGGIVPETDAWVVIVALLSNTHLPHWPP